LLPFAKKKRREEKRREEKRREEEEEEEEEEGASACSACGYLVLHGREFFLTSGIKDIQHGSLFVYYQLLAIRIL
jgi:hypothetical protein